MAPNNIQLQQAFQLHRQGKLAEAARVYEAIVASNPQNHDALHYFGLLKASAGDLIEAKKLIEKSLSAKTTRVPYTENYVSILFQAADYDRAVQVCARAIRDLGINQTFQYVLAISLYKLGRIQEALVEFDRLLLKFPGHLAGHNEKASVLAESGRLNEAMAHIEQALKIDPNYPDGLLNKANVLTKLERYDEALSVYQRAIQLSPGNPHLYLGLGNVFRNLNRHDEAIAAYDRALALLPGLDGAWLGRGTALADLRRYDEALAAYDKVLALDPGSADAWLGRGNVFAVLRRHDDALAAYDKAIALNPDLAEAWFGRGKVFTDRKRYDESFAAYDTAYSLKPDLAGAEGFRFHSKLQLCDWKDFEAERDRLIEAVRSDKASSAPFAFLGVGGSSGDEFKCARSHVRKHFPVCAPLVGPGTSYDHERIRLGYLSTDFRDHPVGQAMAALLEIHDRSRFEVVGLSIGPDDGSDLRARIVRACDRFHDVRSEGDSKIARLIKDLEIDILVKNAPHTEESRLGILALRPAPIQVNALSAWTSGADFMDYVMADRLVLPFDEQQFYSERIVHVPDSFFLNDPTQDIAAATPGRESQGLPENAFVFCGFNNYYKLNPGMFDVWMRLLERIEGSVLWLGSGSAVAAGNLKREAAARKVDPSRLVFSSRTPSMSDHLARYRLADLFLDTLPYGGHTTARDALWAGLPVLTCRGRTFVGRMAVSQLHAVGLADLVTDSLDDYEAMAARLAQDPAALKALRDRLAANRLTHPLFDMKRMTRNFEAAYIEMWERQKRGEAPRSFSVQ